MFYARRIDHLELSVTEYDEFIRSPFIDEHIGSTDCVAAIVVSGDSAEIEPPGSLPVVVLWVGSELGGAGPEHADVVVAEDDLDQALGLVRRSPIAAPTFAVLLRHVEELGLEAGLAAESACYSALQSGPEFAAWRASAAHSVRPVRESMVDVERFGDHLVISLDRPETHNAISAQLRDELHAALRIAICDRSVRSVTLRGNGPSYCSGGDLHEFGQRSNPASAHVIRLTRSPARSIAALASRTTVELHGAAMGGGIEVAAFAHRVIAHPDTRIALPEVALGLIPGAGGTVSMPRRIGRQRTAALALSGRVIGAPTALSWGLVDEIDTHTSLRRAKARSVNSSL